ncbi:MAG: hypothetical protein RIC12_00335 [Pirellulales bacterium]
MPQTKTFSEPTTPRICEARLVMDGSQSSKTRAFYRRLEKLGRRGRVAAQLFRSQKTSSRAKKYRGGLATISYSELSYRRKGDSLEKLCELLKEDSLDMDWGGAWDPDQDYAPYILYVDLPQGQISFHSISRFSGPDYSTPWDGKHASEDRIVEFAQTVVDGAQSVASVPESQEIETN